MDKDIISICIYLLLKYNLCLMILVYTLKHVYNNIISKINLYINLYSF